MKKKNKGKRRKEKRDGEKKLSIQSQVLDG